MAIAVGVVTGGWGATLFNGGFWGAVAGGAIGAFSGTLVATGSLEAAVVAGVFGALSGGLAHSIGHGALGQVAKELGSYGKHITHGVAQGVVSVLQGGKFKSGFIGGFVGHGAKGLGARLGFDTRSFGDRVGRTMVASIAGGTISQWSGGKFANGAVSAAFTHLFNAEGMLYKERKYYGPVKDVDLAADLAKNQYKFGVGADVRIGDGASVSAGALFGGGRGLRLYFATSEGVGLLGLEGHFELGMATPGNANVPGGFEGAAHSFEIDVAAPKFTAIEFGGANSLLDPDSHFIQFEIGSPTAAGGGYQESYTRSICMAFCP